MKYQQTKTPQRGQFGAQRLTGNGSQTRNGGRQVMGEILNSDEKSITVKLTDGSSKIVLVSQTTTINKAAEGTKTDLTAGTKVAVFGTENADGSVTAQNIQLNPMFRNASQGGGSPR